MRRFSILALVALVVLCAACQALLSFDERDTRTDFPGAAEGGSDGGAPASDGSTIEAGDGAADGTVPTGLCAPSPTTAYCADFNGPDLEAYGPFPTGSGGYTRAPGGLDGTTRLAIAGTAPLVTLYDLGAGAERSLWRLSADVGCTTGDAGPSFTGTRGFLGLVSSNGDAVPLLFCTRDTQGLQIKAGFWNPNSGEYVPTIDVLDNVPADGALRHVELTLQQSGSNVTLSVLGSPGGSVPGSAALSGLRLATGISGQDFTFMTTYVDNLILRRQ